MNLKYKNILEEMAKNYELIQNIDAKKLLLYLNFRGVIDFYEKGQLEKLDPVECTQRLISFVLNSKKDDDMMYFLTSLQGANYDNAYNWLKEKLEDTFLTNERQHVAGSGITPKPTEKETQEAAIIRQLKHINILDEMAKNDELLEYVDGTKLVSHLKGVSLAEKMEFPKDPAECTQYLLRIHLKPKKGDEIKVFLNSLQDENYSEAYDWLKEKLENMTLTKDHRCVADSVTTPKLKIEPTENNKNDQGVNSAELIPPNAKEARLAMATVRNFFLSHTNTETILQILSRIENDIDNFENKSKKQPKITGFVSNLSDD